MNPVFGDVSANIANMCEIIKTQDTDLIIFPELATCGYFFTDRSDLDKVALESDSNAIAKLRSMAAEMATNVVFGFAERDGESIYNSALLINSFGETIGLYRKVHLFYYEKVIFDEGNLGFPVFDIRTTDNEVIKIGMQICYDWRFPEATRTLVGAGAQVIVIPACIVTTTGMLHDTLRVRAFENKVIVAFADRIGQESNVVDGNEETLVFRGESCIVNYNGEILSSLDTSSEKSVTVDVSPEKTNDKRFNQYNDLLLDRRPESYIF